MKLHVSFIISEMDTMVFPLIAGGRRPDHIPIVACNVDLVWMADVASQLPRIGHGTFIHILDSLYEKLTGQHLQFRATLGKPTEVNISEILRSQLFSLILLFL